MTYEKLEHSQVKATFEVSKEEFDVALDEAFKICNEKVTIKGFRKGKAPKKLYLEHYGVESLYHEAIDAAINRKIREELLEEKSLQMASQPVLNLVNEEEIAEGNGFKFTLTFDVFPEIKLGKYKGIEFEALSNVVTDSEIEAERDRLLASKTTLALKEDKTIALGDTAVFDFLGTVDGVAFPGGAAEKYELKIGSHQFIPGFEEQMIGMVAGTEKDINVTFPEQYEPSLASKDAVFHITLHEVKTTVNPELTDELVKELNIKDVETVDAFNAHVLNTLTTRKENNNNRMIENKVLETVCENALIDLPNGMIKEREASLRAQVENQAKQYNIPFETFLQFTGSNIEAFNLQCHDEAIKQIKMELVFDKIAEVEGLLPTDEQINEAIKNYALSIKKSEKEVIQRFGKAPFAAQLAYNAAITFVLDNKVSK